MRKLLLGLVFAVSGLALGAGSVRALDPSPLRSLITADDSRGWEGVGRIDIGRRGFCTGALIAPDLVLTAAHCLYNAETGARVPLRDIQFLAGFRNGRASADRRIDRVAIHPEYVFSTEGRVDHVSKDVALLKLNSPILSNFVKPFEIDKRPRKGDEVGVVSYARDRSSRPALQEVCQVLARPSGALVLSCDADFGSSGAPVFVVKDGVARIVSVISAKAEILGRQVSLGTGLQRALVGLKSELAEPQNITATKAPTVRRLVTGSGTQGAGAKFLRP